MDWNDTKRIDVGYNDELKRRDPRIASFVEGPGLLTNDILISSCLSAGTVRVLFSFFFSLTVDPFGRPSLPCFARYRRLISLTQETSYRLDLL